MSLDNFQIPSSLLPELYKDSLVVLESKQIKTESLKDKSPVFLGQFKKKILLLVEDENAIHLNDSDTAFLTGILNACNLNFTDIALLNIFQNKSETFESINNELAPAYFILFGINPDSMRLSFELEQYYINKKNNCTFFSADSLNDISQNIEKKKQLWNALKIIFSL